MTAQAAGQSTAKVVFVGRAPERDLGRLAKSAPANFSFVSLRPTESVETMIREISDADFLLCEARVGIKDEVYRAAKKLKLLHTWGMGYEHFPLPLLKELGIPIANVGGANAITVAEHAVTLMLMLLRQVNASAEGARQGKLRHNLDGDKFSQLYRKTVGIVGFGNIGRWTGRIVSGFGAAVIFYDVVRQPMTSAAMIPARQVAIDELLRTADIISLHVPLNAGSAKLIGEPELGAMRRSALLINTCRGEVVDEQALIRALEAGQIAGAGLDVFEQEPVDPDNPLLHMENVVFTPHTAGFAHDNFSDRLDHIWSNFEAVLAGRPAVSVVS